MKDYFTHVQSLTEEKLVDEIESINKRLLKAPPGPIYNQLLGMLNEAEGAYHDMMITSMHKNSTDEVINIGEIESVEYVPDYTDEEIMIEVVKMYTEPQQRRKK